LTLSTYESILYVLTFIVSSTDYWPQSGLILPSVRGQGVEQKCPGHEVPTGADGALKVSDPQTHLRGKSRSPSQVVIPTG